MQVVGNDCLGVCYLKIQGCVLLQHTIGISYIMTFNENNLSEFVHVEEKQMIICVCCVLVAKKDGHN